MAKVSLVLGGGGARGAAHVGATKALQERGVAPELVVGVSVGALVGAVLCAFSFSEAMERLQTASGKAKLAMARRNPSSPYLQSRQIFSTPFKRRVLENELGLAGIRFCDLHTPFFLTAVALPDFRRVTIGGTESQSNLVDGLLASSAVRWPYSWNGKLFLDGGIAGNLPARIAQEKGSDCIFAVNLGFLFKRCTGWEQYLPWKIIDYWGKQMVDRELRATRLAGAQVYEIYSPRVEAFSVYDFSAPEELQEEGYEACCRILEKAGR